MYGRVTEDRDSHVVTEFFYFRIPFLPIVPFESHLTLVDDEGVSQSIPQHNLHLRSICAAYARLWGLLATIWLVVAGLLALTSELVDGMAYGAAAGGPLAAAGLISIFVWTGQLPAEQRAKCFALPKWSMIREAVR